MKDIICDILYLIECFCIRKSLCLDRLKPQKVAVALAARHHLRVRCTLGRLLQSRTLYVDDEAGM